MWTFFQILIDLFKKQKDFSIHASQWSTSDQFFKDVDFDVSLSCSFQRIQREGSFFQTNFHIFLWIGWTKNPIYSWKEIKSFSFSLFWVLAKFGVIHLINSTWSSKGKKQHSWRRKKSFQKRKERSEICFKIFDFEMIFLKKIFLRLIFSSLKL